MKAFNTRSYVWIIYTILWGMVWGYPVFTAIVVAMRRGSVVSWDNVLHDWAGIYLFFLLFLLHRLPLRFLFLRHRVHVYVLSIAGMLCLFGVCRYRSTMERFHTLHMQEHRTSSHEQPSASAPFMNNAERKEDITGKRPDLSSPRYPHPAGHRPVPEGLPKPLLLDLVIAALMLGFDLAIALLSRYQEEQEKARKLETEHLRYELEHLKAQLNPHFFMNMLNNIHGMVELDSSKAQVMIMELSKLMRYVLYEGAKPRIQLYKETDFISNYVELMRKRYSSRKVRITLELPDKNREHVFLPPLLFISIIENAFKHGISYQNPSFVEIRLHMEKEKLHLICANSIHRLTSKNSCAGGVGLANLRQRLQLLYGKDFTLDITEEENTFHVNMIIPYEYDTNTMHCR